MLARGTIQHLWMIGWGCEGDELHRTVRYWACLILSKCYSLDLPLMPFSTVSESALLGLSDFAWSSGFLQFEWNLLTALWSTTSFAQKMFWAAYKQLWPSLNSWSISSWIIFHIYLSSFQTTCRVKQLHNMPTKMLLQQLELRQSFDINASNLKIFKNFWIILVICLFLELTTWRKIRVNYWHRDLVSSALSFNWNFSDSHWSISCLEISTQR